MSVNYRNINKFILNGDNATLTVMESNESVKDLTEDSMILIRPVLVSLVKNKKLLLEQL